MIRRAKGHVSVVSAPGSGTLVKVLLPAHEVDRSVAKSARSEVAEAQPSRTVLVVDDEATVRRALRRTLERGGYRIIEASDAYVAQHMIRNRDGPIDLLVTDVIMSRMRGTELAQWVSDEHPGIPVLLISGYTDSSLIQEWVDQDPDVFLAKPFEPAELLERVARRLARPTRDASG